MKKGRQSFANNRALGSDSPGKKSKDPQRRTERRPIETRCSCGWVGPAEKFGTHEHKKRR